MYPSAGRIVWGARRKKSEARPVRSALSGDCAGMETVDNASSTGTDRISEPLRSATMHKLGTLDMITRGSSVWRVAAVERGRNGLVATIYYQPDRRSPAHAPRLITQTSLQY